MNFPFRTKNCSAACYFRHTPPSVRRQKLRLLVEMPTLLQHAPDCGSPGTKPHSDSICQTTFDLQLCGNVWAALEAKIIAQSPMWSGYLVEIQHSWSAVFEKTIEKGRGCRNINVQMQAWSWGLVLNDHTPKPSASPWSAWRCANRARLAVKRPWSLSEYLQYSSHLRSTEISSASTFALWRRERSCRVNALPHVCAASVPQHDSTRVVASFLAACRQFWHVSTVVNFKEGNINNTARDSTRLAIG